MPDGKSSIEPELKPVESVVSAAPAKPRRMWGVLATIGTIAILIPVGLVVTYVLLIDAQTKEQAKIAQSFVKDLQQSRPDEAYSMTTKAFRQNSDAADFKKTVAQVTGTISPETPVVNVRRLQTNFGVATAYIGLNIGKGSDGDHAVVMLRKDDGTWKVNGVQFKSGTVDKNDANNEITNIVAQATQ